MSDLYSHVLQLNKGYTPIHIKTVADTICDAVSGVSFILEHEKTLLSGEPNPYYYSKYSWEQWANLTVSTKLNAAGQEEHFVNLTEATDDPSGLPAIVKAKRVVQGGRGRLFRAPFVTIHSTFDGFPDLDVRFSRKNVWLRDGCKCQYCGNPVSLQAMAWDHVKPKGDKRASGGVGTHSWNNVVCACFDCNIRKGMRTPEQAKMPLSGWVVPGPDGMAVMTYAPFKPKWYPLFARYSGPTFPEWEEFLPEAAKNRPPVPVRHGKAKAG